MEGLDDLVAIDAEERVERVLDRAPSAEGFDTPRTCRRSIKRPVSRSTLTKGKKGPTTHLDAAHALLADKVDRDGEARVGIVALGLKLEAAALGARRRAHLVEGPLEVARVRVDGVRPVRGRLGDARVGAGRERDRDDDVVQRQGRVLELVLEVDGERARVG